MTDITARLADALRAIADSDVHPVCCNRPDRNPDTGEAIGCCGSPEPEFGTCAQIAMEALAAYESERVGWQPIETAPKNECVLVLAHKQQFVAWLQDDAADPWLCGAGEESGLDGMWCVTDNKLGPFPLRGGRPTHWMPLPAAPVQP